MASGIKRLGNVTVACQHRCMTDIVTLRIGQQYLTQQRPKLQRWLRSRTSLSCEPRCDPMRGLQIVLAGTGNEKLDQFRSAVAEVGEVASVQLGRHLRLEAVDEFIINVTLPPLCGRYLRVDGHPVVNDCAPQRIAGTDSLLLAALGPVDNIPGGCPPIPHEVFDRIVGSITLKKY